MKKQLLTLVTISILTAHAHANKSACFEQYTDALARSPLTAEMMARRDGEIKKNSFIGAGIILGVYTVAGVYFFQNLRSVLFLDKLVFGASTTGGAATVAISPILLSVAIDSESNESAYLTHLTRLTDDAHVKEGRALESLSKQFLSILFKANETQKDKKNLISEFHLDTMMSAVAATVVEKPELCGINTNPTDIKVALLNEATARYTKMLTGN